MKIGYPCINRTLPCSGNKTFRLASYSEIRLRETVNSNLACLLHTLKYNIDHNLMFFRISSGIIPFASHPVCAFDWAAHFKNLFREIGDLISENGIRISMHPDQFTIINSPKSDVVQRSTSELLYHAQVLDLLGTDITAKIQVHIGGAYGDKESAKSNFAKNFLSLDKKIQRRLVIENDDTLFSVRDCLDVSSKTGVPVLFDNFHDMLNGCGMGLSDILQAVRNTWKAEDGIPMVDYSSQERGKRPGTHAQSIDLTDFKRFLKDSQPVDFDVMLEIKDKEGSAVQAVQAARNDPRTQK